MVLGIVSRFFRGFPRVFLRSEMSKFSVEIPFSNLLPQWLNDLKLFFGCLFVLKNDEETKS